MQALNPFNTMIYNPNLHSILGRAIRITDDVIRYRQWIRQTFTLPDSEGPSRPHPLDLTVPLPPNDNNLINSARLHPDNILLGAAAAFSSRTRNLTQVKHKLFSHIILGIQFTQHQSH